jgi:hypothetical protein
VGQTGVIATPEEIAVKAEGWVSNSRVVSHAVPRWSSLTVNRGMEQIAVSEVIGAVDEAQRCRERLAVSISVEDLNSPKLLPDVRAKGAGAKLGLIQTPGVGSALGVGSPVLSLGPGATLHVRLRFDHQHILYGDYDPLLGVRTLELSLSGMVVRDVVPLDREQYVAQPKFTWPEPPEGRRDTRHAVSGPDSLHLEVHVQGHQSYRYPDRPVRYSTKMRLRFWYLIAAGTEGECRVVLAQYKDTPISWGQLDKGCYQQTLKNVGRWTKVERIIQTEPEATLVTLEFKIDGDTDIGEMWVDDVSLEPVGCSTPAGP